MNSYKLKIEFTGQAQMFISWYGLPCSGSRKRGDKTGRGVFA